MMHRTFLLMILLIFLTASTGCSASSPRYSSSTASTSGTMDELDPDGDAPDEPAPAIDSTALMRVISEYLGAPYKHGGESGEGMDCSAFTRSVFEKAFSIDLPRSTDRQYATGRKIRRKNIARGDLVFFNTTGHIPSHVGIYIGEGMFAHASVNEGVTLSSLASRYYARRYTGARRILK